VSERRLLIDLGNSRVKWMWANGGDLEIDSLGQGDIAAFGAAGLAAAVRRPVAVLLASVAGPEKTARVTELCSVHWGVEVRPLQSQAEQGGVRNGYREPATLGVDRWLAVVGAVRHHGKPVVIWDIGTAATLDAVDESGRHLGGWILPGPAAMLDALGRQTELQVPAGLGDTGAIEPGRSTAECIRQGLQAAQLGTLDRFLSHVSARIGRLPKVVVTGGAAETASRCLGRDCVHDPWLVFRGMLSG
jgi:type III pantothenate kinase